jgi:hypothetical protein
MPAIRACTIAARCSSAHRRPKNSAFASQRRDFSKFCGELLEGFNKPIHFSIEFAQLRRCILGCSRRAPVCNVLRLGKATRRWSLIQGFEFAGDHLFPTCFCTIVHLALQIRYHLGPAKVSEAVRWASAGFWIIILPYRWRALATEPQCHRGAMEPMHFTSETYSELRLRYHLGVDPYEPRRQSDPSKQR